MAYFVTLAILIGLGVVCYARMRSPTATAGPANMARAAAARSAPRSSSVRAKARPKAKQPSDNVIVGKWHAISIDVNDNCCQAAKALDGQRFLSREAPAMPLPNCDAAVCRCKYRHHEDRRDPDGDRRNPSSLQVCNQKWDRLDVSKAHCAQIP